MCAPDVRSSFAARHYALLSTAVLALAAFNLTYRLGSEIVTEWDESLYAITAWEMYRSGHWIGTTFMGSLDYYNTKPPLNVWLISLAFKAFGPSLVSLRLSSIVATWLTVAIFQGWIRRAIGPAVAVASSLVLATTFSFFYDHAGRSANTDALFTLLILLTVVALWAAEDHPWRLTWLGPILAAVFLLRGTAVLMPMAITLAVEVWRVRASACRWRPLVVASVVFAVPVTAWMWARWKLDEWLFIDRMFTYDFAARTLTVIEGHPGTPLYYFNILQKDQFDWLVAGVVACLACGMPWRSLVSSLSRRPGPNALGALLCSWAVATLMIPTVMRTKLSWYLVPFYPPFALIVGWVFVCALSQASEVSSRRRRTSLLLVFLAALTVAEAKLMWYSFNRRAIAGSNQGLLLAQREVLGGQRIYGAHWTHSETFVLTGIVHAEQHSAENMDAFFRDSRIGDFLLASADLPSRSLQLVASNSHHRLYCRRE